MRNKTLTRRDFLKLSAAGAGWLGLRPWVRLFQVEDFPKHDRLGRVFGKVEVKSRPDIDSETVGVLYDDSVVPWLREITGRHPYRYRQRWVETPDGYVWGSELQPVRNLINQPVESLPQTSLGEGMWVEVSIPYVDILLERKPISPGFKARTEAGMPLRLYYSQILWVDQTRKDEQGKVWYRVNERFGYGDLIWAPGEAFRPLTAEEMVPISPEVEDKLVVINVEETLQTLSCYEGSREVYFCRISGGKKYDAEGTYLGHSSTPTGTLNIWRKQVSTHMSGGTTGAGYDLPGIGWTSLFTSNGVAIHSTFWHNNFGGELMSHGCVNAAPEDAKWIFRWTNPPVSYDPGDLYSKDAERPPSKVQVLEG
ncbi:MAG: L,D-transpeptidase family protein [Anaerolineales bacterium]